MPLFVISVRDDVRQMENRLDALSRKQLPFAESQAVNRLAKKAVDDLQTAMRSAFDRPTPFTLKAFYAAGSTKKDATTASVRAREFAGKGTPGWKYLSPEIFGGTRRMKRFERALEAHFGEGFTVPGRGAVLNQYGNISQGQIEKILSALGAAETHAGYRANRSKRGTGRGRKQETYFIAHARDGGGLLGIYKVVGSGHVEPVLVFAHRAPSYRPRLLYTDVVAASVAKNKDAAFTFALAQALSTAK